jgi:hypothetical protein
MANLGIKNNNQEEQEEYWRKSKSIPTPPSINL